MSNQQLNNALASRAAGGQAPAAAPTASVKAILASPAMKKKMDEILGQRAAQFAASIITLVGNDNYLQKCEPMSVVQSAMTAAILDLPVDKNLGYAWVVPYKNVASFQIGWKGLVQLALRTAQYRAINAIPVYEGQFKSWNPLSERLEVDFEAKKSEVVTHYVGYFELNNGFKKTVLWTRDGIIAHAKKYSKSYSYSSSAWQDPDKFDGMALKTVVRNMLSKWGILSIEMQRAFTEDEDTKLENGQEPGVEYVDVDYEVVGEGGSNE
ncbi:recombinase RecT [Paenibacillus glycanilyticus]|uniref:recombinase RecT n=1 Tax=Paenibacillus glycanilyticus TaxID=126569 RepID=UPI0019108E4C|nr:recombinase RecT [Paenibacillus glycanilyticus]